MEQYAAEVLKVDEEDGTITLSGLSDRAMVDAKDEFEATEFAEDDIVIYTYAKGEIQSVYAAEKLEGDVTRVRSKTEDGNTNQPVMATTSLWTAPPISTTPLSPARALTSDAVSNGVVAYLDAQGYVAYIDESAVTGAGLLTRPPPGFAVFCLNHRRGGSQIRPLSVDHDARRAR